MATISLGTVVQLASEGYLTLLVPDLILILPGSLAPKLPNDLVTVPDNYFCYLKSDDTPAIGKESGFLYLTTKGYNHFYENLKIAFEIACKNGRDRTSGIGWPAFVKEANDHFIKVHQKRAKKIADLQNKIN